MSPGRLLYRSLVFYRGIHVSVALGVAVGTAVLSGALLVGDSVRGSLRDLTLDRLGAIDHALVADRFFREELAGDVSAREGVGRAAPAVLIRANVEAADTGARASRVNLHGVDERFFAFYDAPAPELTRRDVAINRALARDLGVAAGDTVLVRFQTDTLVPSESVMGRKSGNVRTLRLTVKAVLEDRGAGRFGLSPSQQLPFNAFVSLAALERALDQEGRVNALLVASPARAEGAADVAVELDRALAEALLLDDVELRVETLGTAGALAVETGRIVLEPAAAEAARAAAEASGLEAVEVLTYLANSIAAGERSIPYSTVTAIGPVSGRTSGLELAAGGPAPPLAGDEILLNDWAARDLGVSAGDEIVMSYYVVGPAGALKTETHGFRLKGVVKLAGLATDQNLAPSYKGMSDVARMGDWDPPFPVDLSRIRAVDEDYWERYRTVPKAFVALETAKRLWTSRFGQLTSIRLFPKPGRSLEQARAAFVAALGERIDPASFGLAFQAVKAQGLAASSGATEFSGLFIGFSMFLIAAAAMLVTLLFRLGVESRAKEVGLLLATGLKVGFVRWLLLGEGALTALVGVLIGLPAAVGYGWLMVYGLRTWWSAAVGGSFLELHVSAASLVGGMAGAFLLMLFSIRLSLRRLERLSPRALLAGSLAEGAPVPRGERAGKRALALGVGSGALALTLLAASLLSEAVPAVAAFYGVGVLLLVALLALFRFRLVQPLRREIDVRAAAPALRLGARNSARYPTRSVLSAALVASASFIIVTVAVNRQDVSRTEPDLRSGDGGFRFIAESDVALHREQLGFDAEEGLPAAKIYPLRLRPGEDASCLNLYRPSRPILLGAPAEFVERGGFAFHSSLARTEAERENPWLLLDKDYPEGAIPVFGDANSVMWILHSGLGKTIEVEDGQGRPRKLLIAGMLSRSIFQSQLILSERRFLEIVPDASGFHLFLIETSSPEAGAALEARLADQGFDAQTTAERLAGYLVVENTYLSTFQTLGGLGLLLGTLGLAVVMVRNVIERRGELALLQAIGFPQATISRIVFSENAFLLVFGTAVGAVSALTAVAPHLIGGPADPPWGSLALTLGAIVAVGLGAGAVAVRAGLRTPLLPSLRRE